MSAGNGRQQKMGLGVGALQTGVDGVQSTLLLRCRQTLAGNAIRYAAAAAAATAAPNGAATDSNSK